MTSPVAANLYGVGVGTASTANLLPFITTVNPATSSIMGPNGPFLLGQRWINTVNNETFTLSSLSPSGGVMTATWTQEGGAGAGTVTSVTGTANQITSTPTTGAVVVSLPASITTPGSLTTTTTLSGGTSVSAGTTVTAGTGITATTGNIVASTGNITATAGNVAATAGSVTAGTTVTAGTGLTVTSGGAAVTGTTTINTTGAAVTSIGTGGTGATNIGNATGNTAVTGSLTATVDVRGASVTATGDGGGAASTIQISNVSSSTISTGTGTVKMSTGNNANNTEWLKLYIGTTAFWVPAWTTNAP